MRILQVSKKRAVRDQKFGFGGRKRLGKQNDASSAADMESFRPFRRGALPSLSPLAEDGVAWLNLPASALELDSCSRITTAR